MRLQLALLNVTQAAIARGAGVSAGHVSNVIKGRRKPTERVISAIAAKTGLPEAAVKELLGVGGDGSNG